MSITSGHLVIISGPSGAGKSTVVRQLLSACPLPLELSISATTRPPRANERDGIDYWYLSDADFQARREKNEFLECCEVFGRGTWYGTLREPVTTGLKQGKWVILEIDVQGARQAASQIPDAITLFIRPGSLAQLEQRLRGRGTEQESSILRRLEVAREELLQSSWYRHIVVNENVEQTTQDICRLLTNYKRD